MNKTILLFKNSGVTTIKIVLEPWVHLYPLGADKTVEVRVEDPTVNLPIEIEYVHDEIILHAGQVMSVWANGVELDPQFR